MKKGFTLIETLIYIALFTLILGSAFVISYQLIAGSSNINSKNIAQAEIDFVLKKINWSLTGMTKVSDLYSPNAANPYSNILSLNKFNVGQIDICLYAGQIKMREGGGAGLCSSSEFASTTSDNVIVSSLSFHYIAPVGGAPAGIEATTTINGIVASTTKYLRK